MSKQMDALKLALEALELEDMACRYEKDPTPEHIAKTITAIREALEQPEHSPDCALLKIPSKDCDCQPEQDPVVKWDASAPLVVTPHPAFQSTPPHRKPLTEEEILHRVDTHVGGPSLSYPLDNSDWINFARAIEQAHGIKE